MPEMLCVFWKFAICAGVGDLMCAKNAVSYCCMPAIVDV
jgi:hypothetical protein